MPDFDIAPENGENFYSPAPEPEQVAKEKERLETISADSPALLSLIADLKLLKAGAESITGLEVGGDAPSLEAQILAKQIIARWCDIQLNDYESQQAAIQAEIDNQGVVT